MEKEFKFWMKFFGKCHSDFKVIFFKLFFPINFTVKPKKKLISFTELIFYQTKNMWMLKSKMQASKTKWKKVRKK